MKFLLTKLKQRKIWRKIYVERLSEPLHLNVISLFYVVFGSLSKKIEYDLIVRPHHAFSIWKAAEAAQKMNIKSLTLIEFGVASGAGLMNMAEIAAKVSDRTGISFRILGVDSGKGMPSPESYRDHPE